MILPKKPSPMKLFDTILYRSRSDDGSLAADETEFDIPRLLAAGLVQEGGFAVTYDCGCENAETTFVEWIENPQDGTLRPFIKCRYCGVTRLEIDALRTWTIQNPVLLQMISKALGFDAAPTEVLPGIVWQLGRRNRRDLYYVRKLCSEDFPAVRSFFVSHPKAVIIVSTKTDKETCSMLFLDNHCVEVQEFMTMDEEYRLTADWMKVETELEPLPSEKKKSSARRGNRAANIEKLIAEMKEHYRTSKSNYYANGKLLPRPTQEEFAARIGIGQREVSRCLADPNAMLFKLLWNQAEDIPAVLNS